MLLFSLACYFPCPLSETKIEASSVLLRLTITGMSAFIIELAVLNQDLISLEYIFSFFSSSLLSLVVGVNPYLPWLAIN